MSAAVEVNASPDRSITPLPSAAHAVNSAAVAGMSAAVAGRSVTSAGALTGAGAGGGRARGRGGGGRAGGERRGGGGPPVERADLLPAERAVRHRRRVVQ